MSDPSAASAIFISYAREDAVAADRIAEALRSHGLEVWFDQNELRGGDSWDQKIRTHIRTCTLLIPIVSANTQTRGEGYFRREWKLAAERTHDMAAGIPFLVPVVIDDTAERSALVPEEFMRVQWTRLPQGRTTPQFAAQVKRLLEAPRGAAASKLEPVRLRPGERGKGAASPANEAKAGRRVPAAATWALAVGAVIIGGVLLWRRAPEPTPAPVPNAGAGPRPPPTAEKSAAVTKSIAVLPFSNPGSERTDDFADGVHIDVITNLAKVRDLKVIARNSVLAYRDAAARDLRKIAADLDVATVLEGTVRRQGNNVRVTANLIDVRSAATLWAESYDDDLTNVFALQAKLAQMIAAALKATLTNSERAQIERRPTGDQAAYETYLRARVLDEGLTTRSSRDRYEQVVGLYEQAVARDGNFSLAHARLAELHGTMFFLGSLDPSPRRRTLAEASLQTAARLAPDGPETLAARGSVIYYCENDWLRALAEMRRAETGLPNDSLLLARIGYALRRTGDLAEATRSLVRATELNPHELYSGTQLIQTLFIARRYQAASDVAQRYVARYPSESYLRDYALRIRFALDGDREKFVRERTALGPQDNDPHGLRAAYENGLLTRDFAAALRALRDPRLASVVSLENSIAEPAALHRAFVEFLRGDAVAAGSAAEEALAHFRTHTWVPRQETMVAVGRARAAAYAGRADDAIREARGALTRIAGRDSFLESAARIEAARVFAALSRHSEAIELLGGLHNAPWHFSAHEIRHDPLLSRLKDDPRFEEILKLAKPL